MSRSSTAPAARQLTLTEELEKLEQSITLTLQEIDHNFSRAHRIVTANILPVVEQYAEHSRSVWEGSKFWKQFFEAAANVSLSGYEEPLEEEEETATLEETTTTASDAGTPISSTTGTPSAARTPSPPAGPDSADATALLSSPDYATPRATPRAAAYASPYEALRRQIQGDGPADTSATTLPSTPRAQTRGVLDADADPASHPPPTTASRRPPAADVLLHRVLDRNYRVQATPHRPPPAPLPASTARTPGTARRAGRAGAAAGSNYTARLALDSSPLEEAPQLHTDLWRSPGPRVPGVSVLATPGRGAAAAGATRGGEQRGDDDFDDDDDDFDDLLEGMSPPKTMQFHIPQSKLLKTPAREASRQIVADLMQTAGADITEDEELPEEGSPSVVARIEVGEESF